jgi:hypothetical protein
MTHSSLPSVELKDAWSFASTHVFMAWCLTKYKINFSSTKP